ncbi:TonB-dependent receptor domain-containing protein [Acinetobacter guillouiae]|jgi:outer membrane receptor protein involved in Fe transport|uniref:TonB-dependent receptor domain-containing protein n=1 Tax=Acinetobacter guillouiae TaxID=106649 RepID=UPI00055746E1|nr:TonB-dependent receptor [Acinetobacter guillouiae]
MKTHTISIISPISFRTTLYLSIMGIIFSPAVSAKDVEQNTPALPTIAVTALDKSKEKTVAYKSGNMDIPRTEDDVQAYTLIEREELERSGVTTVTEALAKLLPMATSSLNNSDYFATTSSQINLRGLGANQTLVLINGRRSAGTGNRGTAESTQQPNLNNIPLAAIERIEILPTSAAAIYGSGAIGGVINVVLRKDYVGTDLDLRYANTTDDKRPVQSFNFVSGFALEEGRTNVMLMASKKSQDGLLDRERGHRDKQRQNILKNNPNALIGPTVNPPAGNLTNIRSKDGSELIPGSGSSTAHIPKGWNGDISKLGKGYALGLGTGVSGWSGDYPILYDTDTESVAISMNRDFSDRLNVFLEAGYDREKGWGYNSSPHGFGVVTVSKNSPYNPFGKDVLVNYTLNSDSFGAWSKDTFETTQKKAATGFTFELTPEWLLSADYSWSKSDIRQRYIRKGNVNPKATQWNKDTANNLIDFIEDYTTKPTDIIQKYWHYTKNNTQQTLNDMSIRATGPVATWYAGDIQLATGIEHRRYESEGYADHQYVDNPWVKPTERKTQGSSVYTEFKIPLLSPEYNFRFAKLLEMQLAARYEDFKVSAKVPKYDSKADPTTGYRSKLLGYTDSGTAKFDALTPTIGFKFAPNDQIMLRASYSEGFVTPTAGQLALETTAINTSTSLKDPVTGKILDTSTDIISGGNPNITPEKSKSYNFGVVLTPEMIENLRLSVDYYQIKKTNNITSVGAQYILDNQDKYGNRVKRDANGDVTSIDTTVFNALGLKTKGIDTNLSYAFDSAVGNTSLNLGYTYVSEYKQQDSVNTPFVDFVSMGSSNDYPLKHRANASIYLQPNDTWGFGWAAQYYGSYTIANAIAILNQTGKDTQTLKINDQIYHDVFAKAKLPLAKSNKLNSAEVGFGIQNLFNDYTVDMSSSKGYLSKYSDVRGRQYYLNLKMSF